MTESKSRQKGGINWLAIKTSYIAGEEYAELSKKYGAQESNIRQRVKRGNWSQERHTVTQTVTNNAIAAIIDEKSLMLIELNKLDLSSAKLLRDKANLLIENSITPNELKAIAGTFESAQKIARLALGAATENTNVSTRTLDPLQDADFLG